MSDCSIEPKVVSGVVVVVVNCADNPETISQMANPGPFMCPYCHEIYMIWDDLSVEHMRDNEMVTP